MLLKLVMLSKMPLGDGETRECIKAALEALSIITAGSQAVSVGLVARGCSGLAVNDKYKVAVVLGVLAQPGDRDVINLLQELAKAGSVATSQALMTPVKVAPQDDEEAVDFLLKCLVQCGRGDRECARKMAWALGAIAMQGNKRAIDFLMARTERKEWWVRCYAVFGLGKVSKVDQSVINLLEKLIRAPYSDENEKVLHFAIEALGTAGQSGDVTGAFECFPKQRRSIHNDVHIVNDLWWEIE